jgi:4-amino-4-deoxy-L-arabinose transferase-like glycosyltransferase
MGICLTRVPFRKVLSENYPLLSILIGIGLVSVSIGPFQNGDTQWEYEAATGVIRWGMPYVSSFGNLMDQPPLGFYLEAFFLKIFGSSIDTGVALVTVFGLGCTALMYKIGKVLYGKTTGLFAAALFALSPWQLILSRSFLIDVQCLFFSLLCLLAGIYAIRKDSLKLFIMSGALFAAAFLTKSFAVFTLIPLLLFYVHHRPNNLRSAFSWLGAFFLPVLLCSFLWYQVISGQGLFYILYHEDFAEYNASEVVPSYFFVGNFLLNYGLGWLFTIAAIFSLLVCLLCKKLFSKFLVYDLICLTTVVTVVSVNTFLGAGLNLKSPYNNAIKYDYQALPFFTLLAASLPNKCSSLFNSAKSSRKLNKLLVYFTVVIGLFLLAESLFANIFYAYTFSKWNYLLLRVEMDKNTGYSFFNPTPIGKNSLLLGIQYLGFALILFGLVWASRHKFGRLLKLVRSKLNRETPSVEHDEQIHQNKPLGLKVLSAKLRRLREVTDSS